MKKTPAAKRRGFLFTEKSVCNLYPVFHCFIFLVSPERAFSKRSFTLYFIGVAVIMRQFCIAPELSIKLNVKQVIVGKRTF